MSEQWKPVPGFEGLYRVSDQGRVQRIQRKLLTPGLRNGYLEVSLCKNNEVTHKSLHRLVAETFIGPFSKGLQTNHKNGVKTDNRVANLEIVTVSENLKHSFRVLGRNRVRGSKHPLSKLIEADIPKIRLLRRKGHSHKDIAGRFGVSATLISRVLAGYNWKHVKGEL